MQRIPVSLYLDTRRALTSGSDKGKYPVKVRVDFSSLIGRRCQKYYPTGVNLTEDEFEKAISEKPGKALREASIKLAERKLHAITIIKDSPALSPELFELYYSGKAIRSANVEALFKLKIESLYENEQIKTAEGYESALQSITDFADGRECKECKKWINPNRQHTDCPHKEKEKPAPSGLLLHNIDEDFLRRYERWMKSQGNSITTTGIYLRYLRHIFNYAMDRRRKIIDPDLYPFGRGQYVIPSSRNVKKALKDYDLEKLLNYVPQNDDERLAHDFFRLQYYLDGINITDLAHLRQENLFEDKIIYIRQKTIRTEREQNPMVVPVRQEAKEIMQRRAIHSPYVFGIITERMDAREKKYRIEEFRSRINDSLERICAKIGIPRSTTYTARHTVSTKYLRKGVDIMTIKEILGHSSITTTQRYLESIDYEGRKELNRDVL